MEGNSGGYGMKKAKARLDMSIHTPTELKGRELGSIMDAQNTVARGDGHGKKVMMTFQVDETLKAELKSYCFDNGLKIGEAVNMAIREWLENR